MSDIMLDVNKKRFRDVLREHMIEKNGNELIKSDDYALIGIYSRAGKYIVCDSTRSDKTDFRYSISDRLEFDDIESAEKYYEECRNIMIRRIGSMIAEALL